MSVLGNLLTKAAANYGDDAFRVATNQVDDVAKAAAKTVAKKATKAAANYADNAVRATSNQLDDVARLMADKVDDGARALSNGVDDVMRVGSKNVAPVNPETLPNGWSDFQDFLSGKSPVERAIGKRVSKITKADLASYLDDIGYDSIGDKTKLWRGVEDAWYDNYIDGLYMDNKAKVADIISAHRNNPNIGDVQSLYIGNHGRTGAMDAELSDRLGIGRSNTPMRDYVRRSSVAGDFGSGSMGTDPTWAAGENGISTTAHERLHSFQNEATRWDYDDRVRQAYEQLSDDLKPYIHDDATISKFHNGRDVDYYSRPNEQEARMFQNYLNNKKFTRGSRASRIGEWGEEINPAFDRFLETLRGLSAEGVALPAIGIMGGAGVLGSLLGGSASDSRRA